VWAPNRKRVEVVAQDPLTGSKATALDPEPGGYHSGLAPEAGDGFRYRLRLDGTDCFPDPVSRFQPEGPHGPSQVVDPTRFAWTDQQWRGLSLPGPVIYELHVGTFTREGTFEAARRELPELARLGIGAVEIMPVADFPGRFGWGYDGVGMFAPVAIYGCPDDLRRFVDDAHRIGLGVMLDVVYNHIGPDGNYLRQYSESYFTSRYDNEWGEAINYDGDGSGPVREFVITNARYWIEEFHFDGLRLDATQQIFDSSSENILAALTRAARSAAAPRKILVFAENEMQHAHLARPPELGGYGLDGVWNDDFHHAARVAMTGHNEAYYTDYCGHPQELISAVKHGYLYQGQHYSWQKKPRGRPGLDLRPSQFVTYIQNHDQVANSCLGQRVQQLTTPGRYKALSALLLLAPGTPLIFQGQEFAASSPFCFFADHNEELKPLVREGRLKFISQFPSLGHPDMRDVHPDPGDPATFERCKLDLTERQTHAPIYQMYKDLLELRRQDMVFGQQARSAVDGAVLAAEAFLVRYFGPNGDDRLLLINLGPDLRLAPAPEPLLAPPEDRPWQLLWSSEDPRYGGCATAPIISRDHWRIPGHAAVVMRAGRPWSDG
jgi:maltooligosyltrehalose trehalohydrolase